MNLLICLKITQFGRKKNKCVKSILNIHKKRQFKKKTKSEPKIPMKKNPLPKEKNISKSAEKIKIKVKPSRLYGSNSEAEKNKDYNREFLK